MAIMHVYTYLIKIKDDEFVETVRMEFASDADDFIAKKYPNADIECIEYEDADWQILNITHVLFMGDIFFNYLFYGEL